MLKILFVDEGFCRINYVGKNKADQNVYYCVQDEGPYCVAYRSSTDLEPMSEVKFKKGAFEIPVGNSEMETKVRNFLENNHDL